MLEIIFKYNNKNYIFDYTEPKKLKEILEEFAKNNSLDVNDIFLIYEGEKVNLNTELYIEEQFGLLKKKNVKRLEFLVLKETPFQIIFAYPKKRIIIKVNLNEKMKDILRRFAKEARILLNDIIFQYHNQKFTYENIGDKTANDILDSKIDRDDKLMTISLFNQRNDTIDSVKISVDLEENNKSINDEIDPDINFRENLLEGNIENLENINTKKRFYLKNLIILAIQYTLIISLSVVGFIYKLNEKLIEWDASIEIKYTSLIAFIFLLALIIESLSDYKTKKFMIIFHIFYPTIIIYYSFLLSEFIDSKYIIIGLTLIEMEILSLLFNIIFKKFEIKHFLLSTSLLSVIGLVFFSLFWIKTLYPVIYMLIFYILSNACFVLWILFINKKLKLEKYYYSSLIFNYNLFLGIAYVIIYLVKYIINNIRERIEDDNDENIQTKNFYLKNFIILFIQYIFIVSSVNIGFEFKLNLQLIFSYASTSVKYIPFIAFIFLLSIIIYIIVVFLGHKTENYLIIFHIFYPPFIIYYSFLLSEFIESKYIIMGLILISIEIFSLLFNILFKKFDIKYFLLFSSLLSLISLIFFSIFWIKSLYPILFISIFCVISNLIYILTFFMINKYCEKDAFFYSTLIFNYNIFLVVIYFLYRLFIIISGIYNNEEHGNRAKVFGIFLCQYIFIIIFVWIGFSFGWNVNMSDWIVSISSFVLLIMSIYFIVKCKEPEEGGHWVYHQILLYIPIVIIFCYYLSKNLEEKYILCYLFILFFELLFIILYMYFGRSSHSGYLLLFSLLPGIIATIIFHFFWLKNLTAFIWLLILSILTSIYLSVTSKFTKDVLKNNIELSVVAFNYGFDSLILFLLYYICKVAWETCKNTRI